LAAENTKTAKKGSSMQAIKELFVDNQLVIELKAAKALAPEHEAQLLGYLKATRVEHGLLVNFVSYRFEIRKYALSQA
jgi:GxxExxY protein